MPDPNDSAVTRARLAEVEKALTSSFAQKLEELRNKQVAEERARRLQEEEKDMRRQAKLDAMLELQVQEAEARDKRRHFWMRFILGPSGALAVVVGAVVGYVKVTTPPDLKNEDVKVQVEQAETAVKTAIEEQVQEVDKATKKNELKVERTIDILLDQQVQMSDGHDQLVDMIEKASPAARTVAEPKSVTDGRAKARAIKRAREGKALYDPADPLADLR